MLARLEALAGRGGRQDRDDAALGDRDAVIVEDGRRGLDRDHAARAGKEIDSFHALKKSPALWRGPSFPSMQFTFPGPRSRPWRGAWRRGRRSTRTAP